VSEFVVASGIISIFKSWRISWVGHVARVRERRNACPVLVGKPYGEMTLKDLGLVGRVILKWMLKSRIGGRGLDLTG